MAKTPRIQDAQGNWVTLDSLPLVAYELNRGHKGRDYAVIKGDVLFCDECRSEGFVSKILAA